MIYSRAHWGLGVIKGRKEGVEFLRIAPIKLVLGLLSWP